MISTPTKTEYRKTSKPCRRCKGSGEYARGFCYRCGGHGREMEPVEVPLTAEEIVATVEYDAGVAARAAREAARKARIVARGGTPWNA